MKKTKCRKTIFPIISLTISTLAEHIGSLPVSGLTLMTVLPAFIIIGCDRQADLLHAEKTTTVRIMESDVKSQTEPHVIDILVFNDDKLQKLDSYQRAKATECSTIKAASSAGNKIFTAIVNSRSDRYDWSRIHSREAAGNIHANLEDETKSHPLMSGECQAKAGQSANIILKRLRSEIILNSISCDFRGKAYPASEISNVKVYLTNVNAEVPVIGESPFLPHRIINAGRLNEDDLKEFMEPDNIFHEFDMNIGLEKTYPGICFLCYPNEAEAETPGTPYTRLVIEGELGGQTYYWPIDINREDDKPGISRNKQYIYDVTITRTGTSDPDIPVRKEDAEIIIEVKEWREREEYGVRF